MMLIKFDVNKDNSIVVFEKQDSKLRPRFVGTIAEGDTAYEAWDRAIKNNSAVKLADSFNGFNDRIKQLTSCI